MKKIFFIILIILSTVSVAAIAENQTDNNYIVHIRSCGLGNSEFEDSGSGIIIDQQGTVITAAHVTKRPIIIIKINKKEFYGNIVAKSQDRKKDTVRLRLRNHKFRFPFARLEKNYYPKKNETVILRGYPGGSYTELTGYATDKNELLKKAQSIRSKYEKELLIKDIKKINNEDSIIIKTLSRSDLSGISGGAVEIKGRVVAILIKQIRLDHTYLIASKIK